MAYTYPIAHPQKTLSAAEIHLLLSNPRVLAKRVAEITNMKFIADYLLQGRFDAVGGGVFYETGEEIFAADAPEAVAPGSEYPKTVLTQGEIASAKTEKWGIATEITDEVISRQGLTKVNAALQRLANTVIRHVDEVAWGVIAAKITSTEASDAWDTPGKIAEALTRIATQRANQGTGLELSTVVLSPAQYAKVMGMLLDKGALPRENDNPVTTGNLPVDALGFTWVTSPFVKTSDPWMIDTDQLGGMADEKIHSPGFVSGPSGGVEVVSERARGDKYELRARRVTVPVVLEPMAGVRITGTAL